MTLNQFLKISDPEEIIKIQQIKKYVKKSNKYGKHEFGNIIDLPFKDVEELKEAYKEGDILNLVIKSLKCDYKDLPKKDYKDFIYYLAFIEDQVLNVLKMEQALNKPDEDDDGLLSMCGIEKLEKYGALNVIDNLAKGNMLNWSKIEELPYNQIYTKLLMDKERATVQRTYSKLKTRQK